MSIEDHSTADSAVPSPEAQRFGAELFLIALEVVQSESDRDEAALDRVRATIQARTADLRAAIIAEHGAEAGAAIIEDGKRLALDLRDIAERYWDGKLQ
jgi:hypothetical protein